MIRSWVYVFLFSFALLSVRAEDDAENTGRVVVTDYKCYEWHSWFVKNFFCKNFYKF